MQCVRRVCIPSFIRHPIHSTSAVEFYPRYDLTDDYRTVLCPRSPPFFTFLLLYNYDVREILLMLCVFHNTLHQTPNLSNIRIIFYIFIHIYCAYPAHIRHPILRISRAYPAFIPHPILRIFGTHPAHILRIFGTQSCILLRSYSTFGWILPRISASPVPAISTFFYIIITLYS